MANGLNQLTSVGGSATAHDSKGNLTSDPTMGKTYGYSSENLLISSSGGVTLAYDPLLRLYQVAGASTTRFAYDGLDTIAEYNGSNVLQKRTVFGAGTDEPIVQYDAAGTRSWLTADERGSIVALADDSGNATAINSYDEYGKPGASNSGRFQYTGQMWLPELGLYYYKARFYAPHLGRFMQTDPIGYAESPNLYNYVLGDPVNLTDPLGLCMGGEVYIKTGGTDYAHGADAIISYGYCARLNQYARIVNLDNGGDGGFGGRGDSGGSGSDVTNEKREEKNGNQCKSGYPDVDRATSLLGNIATTADAVAGVATVGALITSETVVGGITFGSIALGAKLVSLGATGLQGAFQAAAGDTRGLASTGVGFVAGLVAPRYIGMYQGIYGAGKSVRDKAVQAGVGLAFSRMASAAVCNG